MSRQREGVDKLNDDLVLRHFIPKERLQWDYAMRLLRGMGESSPFFVLYLSALNAPPFGRYPAWKKTWLFQTLKALYHYIRTVLLHPAACFLKPEGSHIVLESEKLKSHVTALWALRDRYKKLHDTIRESAWIKVK